MGNDQIVPYSVGMGRRMRAHNPIENELVRVQRPFPLSHDNVLEDGCALETAHFQMVA